MAITHGACKGGFVELFAAGRIDAAGSFGLCAEIYLHPWAGFVIRYTYWLCLVVIIGSEIVLLGGRGEGGGGGEPTGASRGVAGGNNFDQQTPEPEHATASASGSPITDEDIPF